MPAGDRTVRGSAIDDQTRCVHWDSTLDVVAFRFPCCKGWWPCRTCHDETMDHEAEVWPADRRDERAVLCGACSSTMTIQAYTDSGHACPSCGASFNPGCRAHWSRYFDLDDV